jgi:hypothetical protein
VGATYEDIFKLDKRVDRERKKKPLKVYNDRNDRMRAYYGSVRWAGP